jgi:hypothetical protein
MSLAPWLFSQPLADKNITVYIDCESCDINYIKREINAVNYTLDALRAQVHVLVSSRRLDTGGRTYIFDFIGREAFEGDRFTMDLLIDPQNTNLERNERMVTALTAGLAVFLAQNGTKVSVQLPKASPADSTEAGAAEGGGETPRKKGFFSQWVYELSSSMNLDRESNRRTLDLRYGGGMNYITDQWRIRLTPSFFYQERFVRSDEQDITFIRRTNNVSSAVIKSLSAHWSAGVFLNWGQNTYTNIRNNYSVAPAVEYSIFPYKDAITKEFTLAYRIGFSDNHYLEETIFFKLSERLVRQALDIRLNIRERWGDARIELSGAALVNDMKKNRLNMDASVSMRVVKGLSFSLGGSYDVVNDQLSLPRGNATLEEILLGQRQLATNFQSGVNFGLRYTFGALYNNIVNTRL